MKEEEGEQVRSAARSKEKCLEKDGRGGKRMNWAEIGGVR